MSAPIRVKRDFAGVAVTGLLAQGDLLMVLADALRHDDEGGVRDLFDQAAAALNVMEGDCSPAEYKSASEELAEALDTLSREFANKRVTLGQAAAIGLRRELQRARLGEGSADDWQARRRVA